MMIEQNSVTLLLLAILILFCSGLLVFTWGKKIPGRGAWLIGAGLLSLIAGIGLDSGLFFKEPFQVKTWMVGWIGARDESGAITVGVYQDALGVAMSLLAVLVAAVFLFHRSFIAREPFPQRVQSAVAVSTAGVALAWISMTPWLSFTGIVLTIIGGFIASGSRWHLEAEASLAVRYFKERIFGFLFAFLGACVLAPSRSPLVLNRLETWTANSGHAVSSWVGACILVLGLFLQVQPFPFLGWTVSSSQIYLPARILLNQVFPAWAAFSLLIKMHPFLHEIGLLDIMGWVAVGSSSLILIAGLFQKEWNSGLASWLAAGFSLCVALLAWGGPSPALSMLFGVSLGALVLASTGCMLEQKTETNRPPSKSTRGIWIKIATFLGAASGTGVIGFVSAAGGLRWTVAALSNPALGSFHIINFFFFVLLGWRLAWNVIRRKGLSPDANWMVAVLPYVWILLSLAVLWTGTIAGPVLAGSPDRVWDSAFEFFFGSNLFFKPTYSEWMASPYELPTLGVYWGTLIVAAIGAYWTVGRKEDKRDLFAAWMPRTDQFLASGYGVDRIAERLVRPLVWMGRNTENIIDKKVWRGLIPWGLFLGTRVISGTANSVDSRLSFAIREILRKGVEVPAKVLQLIQTGDVRWYLFFAISSGFALLLHFLRE